VGFSEILLELLLDVPSSGRQKLVVLCPLAGALLLLPACGAHAACILVALLPHSGSSGYWGGLVATSQARVSGRCGLIMRFWGWVPRIGMLCSTLCFLDDHPRGSAVAGCLGVVLALALFRDSRLRRDRFWRRWSGTTEQMLSALYSGPMCILGLLCFGTPKQACAVWAGPFGCGCILSALALDLFLSRFTSLFEPIHGGRLVHLLLRPSGICVLTWWFRLGILRMLVGLLTWLLIPVNCVIRSFQPVSCC
jgi:hypothetical protein